MDVEEFTAVESIEITGSYRVHGVEAWRTEEVVLETEANKDDVIIAELMRELHVELEANGLTDKADAMWMRLLALRAERRRNDAIVMDPTLPAMLRRQAV